MSLLLVLAAQVAAASPPSPAVAEEIVVIARKMKAWKGSIAKRDGKIVCRTTKSTKDREVDAIRCDAMVSCTAHLDDELTRLNADKALPAAERRKRMTALLQTTLPCIEARNEAASLALAERRARS